MKNRYPLTFLKLTKDQCVNFLIHKKINFNTRCHRMTLVKMVKEYYTEKEIDKILTYSKRK